MVNVETIPLEIRNLTIQGGANNGDAIQNLSVPVTLKHVTLTSSGGPAVFVSTSFTMEDVTIANSVAGIVLNMGAALTIDGAVIHGGSAAIRAPNSGPIVNITNLIVYDTNAPIDFTNVTGSVRFSTLGDMAGSAQPSVICNGFLTIESSILWNAAAPTAAATMGICDVTSSIVGPQAMGSLPNTDPMFVDHFNGDYHLTAASPAIDQVTSGPATDFEGDARPQGVRYDIGADEYKP